MLKDATRGKFDVLMAWGVDRLGRSPRHLIHLLEELHGAHVDLFLHKQAFDTTTPAGRAMFQMMGVFAEFERAMIRERVIAGMRRAKAQGQKFGRKPIPAAKVLMARQYLRSGYGLLKTAKLVGIGSGTVQQIKRDMLAEATQDCIVGTGVPPCSHQQGTNTLSKACCPRSG